VLVHLVDLAGEDPASVHQAVRQELREHGAGLELLPELVVLSKGPGAPDDEAEEAVSGVARSPWRRGRGVVAASSASGAGIERLRRAILEAVPEEDGATAVAPSSAAADPEFEAEHIVYRPEGQQGFDVERVTEGVFEVRGRGIELLVRRHDLENPEALAYLEQRLGDQRARRPALRRLAEGRRGADWRSGVRLLIPLVSPAPRQLQRDVDQRVHVLRTGPPVDDRGPEGDLALEQGGDGEDAAVAEQRLTEAAVELVEVALGRPPRTPAKADDVERRLCQALELRLGVHPGGEVLRQLEVALHHLAVAAAPIGPQRCPDREGARSA
jgi:hypothetical protein